MFHQDNQNCLHLYEADIWEQNIIWEQGSTVPVSIVGKFETNRKKEQKNQSEFRDFIILKQWKKDLTSEDP